MRVYLKNGRTIRVSREEGKNLSDLIYDESTTIGDIIRLFRRRGSEKITKAIFRISEIVAIK